MSNRIIKQGKLAERLALLQLYRNGRAQRTCVANLILSAAGALKAPRSCAIIFYEKSFQIADEIAGLIRQI